MEFFGDLSVPVKILIAFVALAMLAAGVYLVRRFRLARTEPRLALIDTASVDGRRRLVLVRRDNVEHLLLIGGPTDVVIELNINRTGTVGTAPAPVREPKASPTLKPPPDQPLSEGLGSSPPPPRPDREAIEAMLREPVTREPMPREATNRDATRAPPMPVERQRLETLIEEAGTPPLPDAGPAFYPRPSFEPAFQIPPAPKRMPAAATDAAGGQYEESNLAEMAQQLQAALRRLR
jgi:hypothetical protein